MPSPVAQIELPELDVTEEDREIATERCGSYGLLSDLYDLCCRERQLLDALTQLSALREASEELATCGERLGWMHVSINRVRRALESLPSQPASAGKEPHGK